MQPDAKYWKQLAAFGYGSFLEKGIGAVLIKENPTHQFSATDLQKYFQYIPCDAKDDKLPPEMDEMVNDYDPEKEVILMITDAKGQTICLQLTAQKLGITPLEAYKAEHDKFAPGRVYKLEKVINDIQPGFYIYEGEEKALLVFCQIGMDDDEGDICRTKEIIKIHCDYRDYFLQTEMKIRVE